jgi:hypothetical protein
MFPLLDHFDVAHLLGHPAFDHLAKACSKHRWVHEHDLNDPSVHDWRECLDFGTQLTVIRRAELEACVHAVVLFQASMEKVPYFVPTISGRLNPTNEKAFAKSWKALLDQISSVADKSSAKAAFSEYDSNFYQAMRNPIIHGRDAADIAKVNSISTTKVHAGMKAGWQAYDLLLTEAFKANGQTHEPSWSKMCDQHGVPDVLDVGQFPDLGALSSEYMKRHLDGARAASSAD